MSEQLQMKPWQHGYDIAELKAISAVFREQDKPYVLGAFGMVKENTVAEALSKGHLWCAHGEHGVVYCAAVVREAKNRQAVEDFAGTKIAEVQPGDVVVKRIAARHGEHWQLARWLRRRLQPEAPSRRVWVEAWQECPELLGVLHAIGATLVAVKVTAASELVGVWLLGPKPPGGVRKMSAWDLATLCRLQLDVRQGDVDGLDRALERVDGFAQHYSQYNRGGAWAALALRGYYPEPERIEKPTEMSKKWKAEHADDLARPCLDTPLRAALPEAEALIAAVPGKHHRIRLMRLEPGGGELERHADNTDPDAGTLGGQLMRVHIPIRTNPDVIFEGWDLLGRRLRGHMGRGEAWYLDTRKPHRAVNGGTEPRVHLVIDVEANRDLLVALREPADVASTVKPAPILRGVEDA